MTLLLLACTSERPAPTDTSTPGDTADGESGGGETGERDTADTGRDTGDPAPTWVCPTGMSLVPADPPYCIHTWEVAALPEGDTSGPVTAAGGVEVRVGTSFADALAACAATEGVSPLGTSMGPMHLATTEEWVDAGDGVPGEGGTRYPYGDELQPGSCVLPDETGTPRVDDTQLAGSAPGCVSAFGVYDLLGNVWEWTDTGEVLDAATFFAAAEADGLGVSVDGDGAIGVDSGATLSAVTYHGAGVPSAILFTDEAGRVCLDASSVTGDQPPFPGGFLTRSDLSEVDGELAATRLGVTLVERAEGGWHLHLDADADGEPFTTKGGCAWYTGSDDCPLETNTHEHRAEFTGTIGFRCAVGAIQE